MRSCICFDYGRVVHGGCTRAERAVPPSNRHPAPTADYGVHDHGGVAVLWGLRSVESAAADRADRCRAETQANLGDAHVAWRGIAHLPCRCHWWLSWSGWREDADPARPGAFRVHWYARSDAHIAQAAAADISAFSHCTIDAPHAHRSGSPPPGGSFRGKVRPWSRGLGPLSPRQISMHE